MKQTKTDSLIESLLQVAVGFLLSLGLQLLWYPVIGKDFSMLENLATTCAFTALSLARMYTMRRLCNGRPLYQTLKTSLGGKHGNN